VKRRAWEEASHKFKGGCGGNIKEASGRIIIVFSSGAGRKHLAVYNRPMDRKATGERGEELARKLLKKRGYKIIATNYRCPRGEIDIVAREQGMLVFVEVRSKSNLSFGPPEESITAAKQEKMRLSAYHYLEHHHAMEEPWRIDVVLLEMDDRGNARRTELLVNAVGE